MWILVKAAKGWAFRHSARLGAALAYYSIFSLGPLLLIVTSIAGFFFGEVAARSALTQQFRSLLGPVGVKLSKRCSRAQARQRAGSRQHSSGVVLLLMGALGVVVQSKDALNTIWETNAPETAGIWWYLRT